MTDRSLEEIELNIGRLFWSRGDLDAGLVGLALEAVRKDVPSSQYNQDIINREKWFTYLRSKQVRGRSALEIAQEMFRKFATYEDGIDWLSHVIEIEMCSRLDDIKHYSAQRALAELRGMVTASI